MFRTISLRPWISLLVAALALVGAGAVLAQDAESTPEPAPAQECAECHLDVVAQWQDSIHANAYHDPSFQSAWQTQGEQSECLACHTTGFVPYNSTYEHEGVTCSACHGQTPADHPPQPVAVDPGVNVCADCHTTTLAEWERSAHGEQQLACTTCHNPHPQSIRFETTDALCLNCHDEPRTDYAHASHPDQACVDCHWHRSADGGDHALTGELMPTGHDAIVETRTCLECHAQLDETVLVSDSGGEHPLLSAQVRITELQAELATTRVEADNTALSLGVQGLLVGALVTGGLMFGFSVLRRRGHKQQGGSE